MAGRMRLANYDRGRWRSGDSRWARHLSMLWGAVVLFCVLVGGEALSAPPLPRVQYVGALFQVDNFTEYALEFRRVLASANQRPGTRIHLEGVALPIGNDLPLPSLKSAANRLYYICDAVRHNNVTAFLAIGGQDMINSLSLVTNFVGLPLIGYNTEKKNMVIHGERPLYLQLDPSKALIAKVIVRVLEKSNWFYASLITEDSYATDGFIENFKSLTSDVRWRVEDHIRLSPRFSRQKIDYKLLNLLENQSRVIILHCSVRLARRVFQVAQQEGFTGQGYAWFVTESVVTKNPVILADYPVGIIAVTLNYTDSYKRYIPLAADLISNATSRMIKEHPGTQRMLERQKGCNAQDSLQIHWGRLFYRYLKNTTVPDRDGHGGLTFDDDGVNTESNFKLLNLIEKDGERRWRTVGSYKNDTARLNTVVWPGDTVSGPIAMGERTLRVVVNIVQPFVMEQEVLNETKCVTAMPCLRVQTKNKETLDDIFKDFAAGVVNESRPYTVRCCQGFSIMLLEKLGRDLNFSFQLYITADEKYGNRENGTWNGLVEDLRRGSAHMAIAAFSITRSRSRAIDFTDPYFYSGYSILVSERKRSPPIYAFMEPFDGWVWISIVISATVVAVALSLLEWNSPFGLNPWGRKRKTNYTLGSGLNMVYAILFQHTIKTKSPKAWPSKWLQNYWAGASIFIYSSYTANLAAFLAGKNSGVTITGIHDQKLLEPGRQIGVLTGTAVEEFTKKVNLQLLRKARRYPSTLPIETALALLMNETIDAYLDDTPVLEYARTTMDAKCVLRLVGKGFGEDAYGIGLPKYSWLKVPLSHKILEYHESGFIEDLTDLYFRRSRCIAEESDGQLQGEATPMNFDQHAGLYLLLVVGIFVCVILMFLEHATFKWLVPYWRRKPKKSFWKSLSMMFWSQRLYRIITSEELVSPHHSAREMIEVVKNRDFTKLFQKSVRKQERVARNKKNIFSLVEELKWKARREERLSQNPSTQTEASVDSDNSATPVNLTRDGGRQLGVGSSASGGAATEGAAAWNLRGATGGKTPSPPGNRAKNPLVRQSVVSKFSSQGSTDGAEDYGPSKSDDELLASDGDADGGTCASPEGTYKLVDISDPDEEGPAVVPDVTVEMEDDTPEDREEREERERRYSNPSFPLLGHQSSSEDNLMTTGAETYQLPNGMVILSPNGDVFARSGTSGKNILVRPKTFANFKNFTTNLPDSMKTLPLKDNRVKSTLDRHERPLGRRSVGAITNELERVSLEHLSKRDLFLMWKTSERELHRELRKALDEKAELEQKLALLLPETGT